VTQEKRRRQHSLTYLQRHAACCMQDLPLHLPMSTHIMFASLQACVVSVPIPSPPGRVVLNVGGHIADISEDPLPILLNCSLLDSNGVSDQVPHDTLVGTTPGICTKAQVQMNVCVCYTGTV
jgi:hypothetical protein